MCSTCKLGIPWWWLVKAETYVGAIDAVYEKNSAYVGFILWFVIMIHGEFNVGSINIPRYTMRKPWEDSEKFEQLNQLR
jgi:hypothetical protein